MNIAAGQGQTTPRDKILMSTETACHFGHLLQVSKKSLWSLSLYNFLHDFIHVYSPGAGADNPLRMKVGCQQEHLVTSVICCKLKKNLFEVWFYTIFFHAFIHVYSPRAGADRPLGKKFWCQPICLVTSFICCKFKKDVFEVWFYTIFFMIWFMYIAPGQEQTAPWGQNFDVNRKALSLYPIVASFKEISLKSDHTCDIFLGSNREICSFWKGDWGPR